MYTPDPNEWTRGAGQGLHAPTKRSRNLTLGLRTAGARLRLGGRLRGAAGLESAPGPPSHPLLHLPQFRDPSHFHPFHHEDVSFVIETGPVRAHELAGREPVACQLPRVAPVAGGIVAQMLDHLVVAVHQRHPRSQVGNHHVAILEVVEVAGKVRAFDKIDMGAIEREALNAAVPTVRHRQDGFCDTRVHDDAVGAIDFAGFFSFAAERAYVLALAVVLVDVARSVPVAHVEIAVGRDRQIGGAVLRLLAVGARLVGLGLLRVSQREHLFAIQGRLHHDAPADVAQVQELGASLFTYVQPVRAAFERRAPGLDELAVGVEDHHRVRTVAGGIDRVVDVDAPLRVLHHAVRVAVPDFGGQLAPVMEDFVRVIARAHDRPFGSGLIVGPQDGRRDGRGGLEKTATGCDFHLSAFWILYNICNAGVSIQFSDPDNHNVARDLEKMLAPPAGMDGVRLFELAGGVSMPPLPPPSTPLTWWRTGAIFQLGVPYQGLHERPANVNYLNG